MIHSYGSASIFKKPETIMKDEIDDSQKLKGQNRPGDHIIS
jgi:hypothetical protein